jgi:hypothetical protein
MNACQFVCQYSPHHPMARKKEKHTKLKKALFIYIAFSVHYVAMHNSIITVSEPGRVSANSYHILQLRATVSNYEQIKSTYSLEVPRSLSIHFRWWTDFLEICHTFCKKFQSAMHFKAFVYILWNRQLCIMKGAILHITGR